MRKQGKEGGVEVDGGGGGGGGGMGSKNIFYVGCLCAMLKII